jgi:hypothetical protein
MPPIANLHWHPPRTTGALGGTVAHGSRNSPSKTFQISQIIMIEEGQVPVYSHVGTRFRHRDPHETFPLGIVMMGSDGHSLYSVYKITRADENGFQFTNALEVPGRYKGSLSSGSINRVTGETKIESYYVESTYPQQPPRGTKYDLTCKPAYRKF